MFKYIIPGLLLINSIGIDNVVNGSKVLYGGYQYFFGTNSVDADTLRDFKKLQEEEQLLSDKLDKMSMDIIEMQKLNNLSNENLKQNNNH